MRVLHLSLEIILSQSAHRANCKAKMRAGWGWGWGYKQQLLAESEQRLSSDHTLPFALAVQVTRSVQEMHTGLKCNLKSAVFLLCINQMLIFCFKVNCHRFAGLSVPAHQTLIEQLKWGCEAGKISILTPWSLKVNIYSLSPISKWILKYKSYQI